MERLIHIIQQCPAIALQALNLALPTMETMRDPNLLGQLYTAYESAIASGATQESLPPWSEVTQLDSAYLDELHQKNQEEKTKLEVELKTYTSNMIKESIRVSDSIEFWNATPIDVAN